MPRILAAIAGVCAALAVWELALRPFAGQLRAPPWPVVACDSVNAPVVATRQLEEGIALARYSMCGARLTGNPALPGAPYAVLLGDSHVAAREVDDGQTMGARLEAIARAENRPLNVRQYGWRGAAPPQYVVSAPDVLARWNPRHVVVLVADDDLGADVFEGLPPVLRYAADSTLQLDTSVVPGDRTVRTAGTFALANLVRRRWTMVVARAPATVRHAMGPVDLDVDPHGDERVIPRVPPEIVRLLRDAYGNRLAIVYLADTRISGGDAATTKESLLLDACARLGVRCASTRRAMLAARASGRATRGSATTVAGIGHLNAAGHDVVAREIWNALPGRER